MTDKLRIRVSRTQHKKSVGNSPPWQPYFSESVHGVASCTCSIPLRTASRVESSPDGRERPVSLRSSPSARPLVGSSCEEVYHSTDTQDAH